MNVKLHSDMVKLCFQLREFGSAEKMNEKLTMETIDDDSSELTSIQEPSHAYSIDSLSIDGNKIIINTVTENVLVDFVVIDDGVYQDYILSFDQQHHPILDIGKAPSQNLIVRGFEFSKDSTDYSRFIVDSINANEFEMNPVDGSIECPNHLNSYSIVPVVYDMNMRRRASSPNISFHKISFNYGDFQTKASIQAQAVEIRRELREMEQANPDCPPSLLYYENAEYRALIDQLNSLLDAEQQLNESGSSVGVKSAYAYQCKDPKTYILRNGIDDEADGVAWTRQQSDDSSWIEWRGEAHC